MPQREDFDTVRRKTAKSGSVDYGDPVILSETSKRLLTALPLYIPHNDHPTEFRLKLEGYRKTGSQPWQVDPIRTLAISEPGARKLLKMLQTHLAVAEQPDSGEFLIIKISGGPASLGDHDPKKVVKALTQALGQSEILQYLSGTELSGELSHALRGAIRLSEMRTAVAQLRSFLEGGEVQEQTYQDWCSDHCWAFGNAYVMRDDVRTISAGDKLDLLLPSVIAGYRDIVELKRPDKDVLVEDKAHRNFYFSSAVSQAIGQCHRYLDILHREAEHGLLDHKEVVAYHPRAIIVIGRSDTWSDDQQRALHGLNRRLSGITVMTYDHLLAQGERLVALVNPTAGDDTCDEVGSPPGDDDIPW